MTTVVANLDSMAADQRITGGGPLCHTTKLYRIGTSIFGFAGDAILAMKMMRWLATKRDVAQLYKLIPESYRDDISILELSKDGLAYWNGWGERMQLLDECYAIGSGAMSALQALKLRCTPAEAIMQTLQIDECSGVYQAPHVEELTIKKRRA